MWIKKIIAYGLLSFALINGFNHLTACTSNSNIDSQSISPNSKIYFKKYRSNLIRVEYLEPQNCNGEVVLFLPGWNYSAVDWKVKTTMVDSAIKGGFSVLLVDMGKSVYVDSIYPQARADYKNYPTRTWLWNEVLSEYNHKGWFVDFSKGYSKPKSHVFGLSTGARGAALLFLDHPTAFGKVVLLSGDFDPLLIKNDALLTNSMGKYDLFMWRWVQGSNNIQYRFNNAQIVPATHTNSFADTAPTVEFFIAHGHKDKVVPIIHSENLCAILKQEEQDGTVYLKFTNEVDRKKNNRIHSIKIHIHCWLDPQGGHDYLFWEKASIVAWIALF